MSTSTRLAGPAWARVDRHSPAPWQLASGARVVHAGRSCLMLADIVGDVIVVSGPEFGLAPGGIQLSATDLVRLLEAPLSHRVDLERWAPAVVLSADLTVGETEISTAALTRYRSALRSAERPGPMDPRPIRARATSLAADALMNRDPTSTLLSLVGAGPGSTPTGDDVIVGVLAGLRAAGAATGARAIAAALAPMLTRTTTASAHYLRAAAQGRFADRVHDLLRGLTDARDADRAAGQAARWGATSGLDLLAGVVAGATVTTSSRLSA